MIDDRAVHTFQTEVQNYYLANGQYDLPWRQPEADGSYDQYKILVSEIMLQQTQVNRVIAKYVEFISQFPTLESLNAATLGEVLRAWSGLGYNRRAKFLYQAVQMISQRSVSRFPETVAELAALPGIGPNTAGAILAYAYNQPVSFIETNIRTVYIRHFFFDKTAVSDKAILDLVKETILRTDPRSWYWGLMDYGSYLKKSIGNPNTASKSYMRQSAFAGSRRQIRGIVIQLLSDHPYSLAALDSIIDDERLLGILQDLQREELIQKSGNNFSL